MAQRKVKGYGWIPDIPDNRDMPFTAPLAIELLPSSVDLTKTKRFPDIYNQGNLGSCTGMAIAGAIEYDLLQQNLPDIIPSALFIYYNERMIEGTVESDSGAMIRDGIKSVNQIGFCSEECWPYDISKFAVSPSQKCYDEAVKDRALRYRKVTQTLAQMKTCLASGKPFVFGFPVFESIEAREVFEAGNIPLPQIGERVIAGHAVMAVGYDDARQVFLIRNSWGEKWGAKGYGTMPYAYLTDLASDIWVIDAVTVPMTGAARAAEMRELVSTAS